MVSDVAQPSMSAEQGQTLATSLKKNWTPASTSEPPSWEAFPGEDTMRTTELTKLPVKVQLPQDSTTMRSNTGLALTMSANPPHGLSDKNKGQHGNVSIEKRMQQAMAEARERRLSGAARSTAEWEAASTEYAASEAE